VVVSFPPAGPPDEPSESLAPVTSLFDRRSTPAPEADGWFTGGPDEPSPEPGSVDQPVAPVRRLRTAPPPVTEPTASPSRTDTLPPERPRIAWTAAPAPVAASPIIESAGVESLDTGAAAETVDPEVRLAELDLLAVRRLARRGCSEWEIAELLRGHDAEPHEVEHVLDELRRRGYLDDAELARQLVESLHTRKGQSRAVIGRELSARRIDQSVASEALEAIDDDDELRRALVVAEKRAGQLRSLDQATAERRLTAYLARRGYGSAIIREACSRALSRSNRSGVSFR